MEWNKHLLKWLLALLLYMVAANFSWAAEPYGIFLYIAQKNVANDNGRELRTFVAEKITTTGHSTILPSSRIVPILKRNGFSNPFNSGINESLQRDLRQNGVDYLVVLGVIGKGEKYGLIYRLLTVADRKIEDGRDVAADWQQLKQKTADVLQKSRLWQTIIHEKTAGEKKQPEPPIDKSKNTPQVVGKKAVEVSNPQPPVVKKTEPDKPLTGKQPEATDRTPKISPLKPATVLAENIGWFNEKMPDGLKRHIVTGEYISNGDSSVMVYVPAGDFFQGQERPLDPQLRLASLPAQQTTIPAYYIDKYEVTNACFCRFLNSLAKAGSDDVKKYLQIDSPYCGIEKQGEVYISKVGIANYPAVQLSWYGADSYARWAGKALPDERQWEKACRGGIQVPDWKSSVPLQLIANPTPRRDYPWGDMPFDQPYIRTNSKGGDDGYRWLAPVDAFDGLGDSPYRCVQMAGNVWEWCLDLYPSEKTPDHPAARICRGGSWGDDVAFLRCGYRQALPPENFHNDLGFRCVLTIATTSDK